MCVCLIHFTRIFCECFFLFVHYFGFTHENPERERTAQDVCSLFFSLFFFAFLFFGALRVDCLPVLLLFLLLFFHFIHSTFCFLSHFSLSLSLVQGLSFRSVHFKGIFRTRAAPPLPSSGAVLLSLVLSFTLYFPK